VISIVRGTPTVGQHWQTDRRRIVALLNAFPLWWRSIIKPTMSALGLCRSKALSTLLLVLSLKFPNPVISLPSYALFTGSGSLNASNTSSSHLTYKVLTTTQPSYLHNLISIQRPRSTRSSSVVSLLLLGHRHHPL